MLFRSPTQAASVPELKTFAELGVDPLIVDSLARDGIVTAFPIQEMCLGLALEGRDIIGQAKTGTGKTLGFGIPLIQRIHSPSDAGNPLREVERGKPQALVVCPTRELALQVATDISNAGDAKGLRILSVYGGRAYEPQIDEIGRAHV